jgi:hypothetical protein
MGRSVLFSFLIFLTPPWARAEYRVFRLGIAPLAESTAVTNARAPASVSAAGAPADPAKTKELEVITTLDQYQYLSYYHVPPTHRVRILDHWMCRGRTDLFKGYCKSPRALTANALATAAGNPSTSP